MAKRTNPRAVDADSARRIELDRVVGAVGKIGCPKQLRIFVETKIGPQAVRLIPEAIKAVAERSPT